MSLSCKLCPSTELVYSGTDAFCLGVPTETYCYDCAGYIHFKRDAQERQEENIIC